MKKLSQKEIILKLLRSNPDNWFKSYELIKANTETGWLGSGVDRVARDLVVKGLIEKRKEGKYIAWRAKKPKEVIQYTMGGRIIGTVKMF